MTRSEHKARLRALVAAQQTRELTAAELREVAEHFLVLGDERQSKKALKAAAKLADTPATDLESLFDPPPIAPRVALATSAPAPVPESSPAEPAVESRVRPPEESGLAKASWILALLGLVTAGLGSLLAILLGLVALGQIGGSQGRLEGRGRAVGGLVLGLLGIVGYSIGAVVYYPHYQRRQERALIAECRRRILALSGEVKEYVAANGGKLPSAYVDMADLLATTQGDPKLGACPDGHQYKLVVVGIGSQPRLAGPAGPILYEAAPTDTLAAAHRDEQGDLAGHVAYGNGTARLVTAQVFNSLMRDASEAASRSQDDRGPGNMRRLDQAAVEALDSKFKRLYAALTRYAKDNGGKLPRPGLDLTIVMNSYGIHAEDWIGPNGRPLRLNPEFMGRSLAELKSRSGTSPLIFEVPEPGGSGRPDGAVLKVNGDPGTAQAVALDRLR